ncbi:S8 family serine peptidase [Pseudoalteromonas sp. BDTF-M6]|uniref:S8 family serine peptidase n=1 Tax=Pseudoalteromonas sp. BDTF-M6 TaxID=2796132 RepID=UPI001BAF979A|nr:S8 family serine peptidase [Pseudoalteromonas sp. BDTF-M6]MBS3796866.1 S8 family serine peptidase [Pseudoalteromonas sp. BDTF-M6]
MKLNKSLLPLLCLSAAASAATNAPIYTSELPNRATSKEQYVVNTKSYKERGDNLYFVVMKEPSLVSYLSQRNADALLSTNQPKSSDINTRSTQAVLYRKQLAHTQQQLVKNMNSVLGTQVQTKHSYQVAVNAIAVHLSAEQVSFLERSDEVMSVEKVGLHQIQTAVGPEFVGAKSMWQGSGERLGSRGEGVVVGIIDSGINAFHPSFADVGGDGYDHINPLGEGNYFGDCKQYAKFCNDKLIGIVSYPEIIDNYPEIVNTDLEDIQEKVRVGYDFNGHGTHVASTAAGNVVKNVNMRLLVEDANQTISEPSAFTFDSISGVAPHANIVSYQVCNQDGACFPELAIKAIEHAIENNIDVLNYSVGGGARNPWGTADSLAFLNAREAGIHVAVAAGNAGPSAETVGSPGNAPWVTTVAAYTHDGDFSDKTLSGFTGGESTPPSIIGKGATGGYSANVVIPEDKQCLTQLEAGTYKGEIVVCERGDIARVSKGINVAAGGAGGMILINLDGGADNLAADPHVIPAIHVSAQDGEQLTQWLASGSDHYATIGASQLIRSPELGDIAGVFSSRGPNIPYAGVLTPDIAAPGVDIHAAFAEDKPFTEDAPQIAYAPLSGTSMASPHVAGALALIKATRPSWTPSQAHSAIMSTAHQVTHKDDDFDGVKERSTFFDQGAGSLRVNKAVNAGLILHTDKQAYLDADPSMGGIPTELNSTSVVLEQCITSCSWTREVEATLDGTWTASYDYINPGFDLSVSPSTFSLTQGQKQTLTFTASANAELASEWVHGYVLFKSNNETLSDSHFQVATRFKAGRIAKEVSATLNNVDNKLAIKDVFTSGSSDLQVIGHGLTRVLEATGRAKGSEFDSERNSPGTNLHTLFSHAITVKPYTKRLIVNVAKTTSPDVDLYVGIDENNDGVPDATEMFYSLLCISGNADSNEQCILENPPTGNYWLAAHNYEGTSAGVEDEITLEYAQIAYTSEPSFMITAPKTVDTNEYFDIAVTVDGYLEDSVLTALEEGQSYYGLVEVGTAASLKTNVGSTLLKITGKEPQDPNTAPIVNAALPDVEYQLQNDSPVNVEIDTANVFIDEQQDELTLSVSGAEQLSIENGVIKGSFDKSGSYTVVLSASDGQLNTSTSFKLEIKAAPVTTPPTQPERESDSGGSVSIWLLLLAALVSGKRLGYGRQVSIK